MRGTTRDPGCLHLISGTGAEAVLADPDRIATLAPALEHVTVACVLLGSAVGSPEALRALHGPRLEMLLRTMLDTTVRGIVYEAAGTAGADVLASGAECVRNLCRGSRIPYVLLDADPRDHPRWLAAAQAAVTSTLAADSR